MKTNQQISHKLKAYSTAAIALMATIINETVDVDILDAVFDLDSNNDGITDFKLSASVSTTYLNIESSAGGLTSSYFWIGATAYVSFIANMEASGSNAVMTTGGFSTIAAINKNGEIGSNKNFIAGNNSIGGLWFGEWRGRSYEVSNSQKQDYSFYSSSTWSGSSWGITGQTEKYIGLKFMIDGNVHYGWVQFSIIGAGTQTQKLKAKLTAYAYNTEPDMRIFAEGLVGIETKDTEQAKVYSYGQEVRINSKGKGAVVNIYDLTGKQVYTGTTKGAITRLDMRGHQGIYLVKVTANGINSSTKVHLN